MLSTVKVGSSPGDLDTSSTGQVVRGGNEPSVDAVRRLGPILVTSPVHCFLLSMAIFGSKLF